MQPFQRMWAYEVAERNGGVVCGAMDSLRAGLERDIHDVAIDAAVSSVPRRRLAGRD